jgi:hypothetical protein
MNVFERLTAAERQEFGTLRVAWEAATAKRAKLEVAKRKREDAIYSLDGRSGPSALAAFDELENGEAASVTDPGPSREKLIAAKRGAEMLLRLAVAAEAQALGALRARTGEIVKACADRAGAEYALVIARAEAIHAEIAGAQEVLASVTGGHDHDVVDRLEWPKLYVPGSKLLPSLARAGRDRGDAFHSSDLVNAADTYAVTAGRAANELERAIASAIGCYPFGSSAVAAASEFAAAATFAAAEVRSKQDESTRKSRRAVLEKAAEGMRR